MTDTYFVRVSDDFSSQDEDDELGGNKQRHSKMPTQTTTTSSQSDLTSNGQAASAQPAVISRCRAIYSYEPKLYDELELSPGEWSSVIDEHEFSSHRRILISFTINYSQAI